MAVDEQEGARTVVVEAVESAHPGVAVNAIRRNIETAHRADDFGQSPVTEALDLVAGNNRNRGRRVGYFLGELRGRVNGVDLDLRQLIEAEVEQLSGIGGDSPGPVD